MQAYPISIARCLVEMKSRKCSSGIGRMTVAVFQPSQKIGSAQIKVRIRFRDGDADAF